MEPWWKRLNVLQMGDVFVGWDSRGRRDGEYVVEEAGSTTGYGHGMHDAYVTWDVVAWRLHSDGSYDPEGRTLRFINAGDASPKRENIPVLRRMRRSFVPATP